MMTNILFDVLNRAGGLSPQDFSGMSYEEIFSVLLEFFTENPALDDFLTVAEIELAAKEIEEKITK